MTNGKMCVPEWDQMRTPALRVWLSAVGKEFRIDMSDSWTVKPIADVDWGGSFDDVDHF